MKKLFIPVLTALMVLVVSCGSTKVAAPLSSQQIIEVPNYAQADLYDKANAIAAEMFGNAASTLDYADKEAGVLQGEYTLSIIRSGPYYHKTFALVTIEVKDAKLRITFTDMKRTYSVDAKTATYKQKEKLLDLNVKTTLEETFTSKMDLDIELENFVATFVAKLGLNEW